jgi:hypothetical protein
MKLFGLVICAALVISGCAEAPSGSGNSGLNHGDAVTTPEQLADQEQITQNEETPQVSQIDGSEPVKAADNQTSTKIGVFVDSAVAGLRYKTKSGLSGITNESGEFEYREGDNVTFSLGSIDLGTTNAASTLTPVEIVGAEDTSDPKVINVARFLQTLDDDNDPSTD